MNKPILVVLAAGMGSRYGGLKQMDKIGADREAILDYSVFDALRSGFGKIVFVIRHDIEKDFNDIVLSRMGDSFFYEIAFQDLDTLIPPAVFENSRKAGRTKPWGTAHALLCAKSVIDAPFAVINADDFYGRDAYTVMGEFLRTPQIKEGAIVPYQLEQTLSPSGTVTRGICGVKGGFLTSVDELLLLEKEGNSIFNTEPDGSKRFLDANTPVSMNFWGFPSEIFPELEKYFDDFLKTQGAEQKSECYLPKAADHFIKNGKLSFRVLQANSEWFGVTYKEDRDTAARRVAELTKQGAYPPVLWK
ncbi:nucleotidyltransferase [Spirochaetia bacterium]|nr:nucleotidyltransferase [Spirochaetia bacterium]